MNYLWDINLLIARVDPRHEHHVMAAAWDRAHSGAGFVTCPLTENGFVRIYGHPSYPDGPGSPAEAVVELLHLRARPGHLFVSDDISLGDPGLFMDISGVTPRQLTDLYLLALAAHHVLGFATFDRGLEPHRVRGGTMALSVVPAG